MSRILCLRGLRRCAPLMLVLACATVAPAAPKVVDAKESGTALKQYETRYYVIHTDLETDAVKDAAVRMTRMAEEYYERTKEFSGRINQRLPFYLFKNAGDYYDAGGMPGSAGVFMGSRLMAIAGEKTGGATWHVIQHEGFHQFAAAVIGGDMPVWVNEGLAEYFGESLFTGDGFVSGVIPPGRQRRVKQQIEAGDFQSLQKMMTMSQAEWNGRLKFANYDQAWSMAQFLAHGEDGKYQKAFSKFMNAIGRGQPWPKAWTDSFGDVEGFEERWKEYWLKLPDDPTADLYARATHATLTSYLARAESQGQAYDTFQAFREAALKGELKSAPDDWLPPSLLESALAGIDGKATWSLQGTSLAPHKPASAAKAPKASPAPRNAAPRNQAKSPYEAARGIAEAVEQKAGAKPRDSGDGPVRATARQRPPKPLPRALVAVLPDGTRLIGRFTLRGKKIGNVWVDADDLPKTLARARSLAAAGDVKSARSLLQPAVRQHADSPTAAEATAYLKELGKRK